MSILPTPHNNQIMQNAHDSLNTLPLKGILQGIRKFTKGCSGKRIIFFSSRKNGGLMPSESSLERDNCFDLEFDNTVISYRTQPFTIDLGGNESYTPDSIHIDNLGSLYVREVKISGVLKCEKLLDRLDRIKTIFSHQDIQFNVLTEKNLQLPPKINNYKLLYRCSHQKFDKMLIDFALSLLDDACSLQAFRDKCNRHHLPPLIADTTLFLGLALYDENKELNGNSIIWKNGGAS